MLKMSDTNIAAVAKKAADYVCVVTMIDMKRSTTTTRVSGTTNGASTLLRLQHGVVSSWLNAVERFALKVSRTFGIFSTPLSSKGSSFFRMFFGPCQAILNATRLTSSFVSIKFTRAFEELGQWLYFFAPTAPLHVGRGLKTRRAFVVFALARNVTRLAVMVEAVFFLPVFVKMVDRFGDTAGFADFYHGMLPKPLFGKHTMMFSNIQGV